MDKQRQQCIFVASFVLYQLFLKTLKINFSHGRFSFDDNLKSKLVKNNQKLNNKTFLFALLILSTFIYIYKYMRVCVCGEIEREREIKNWQGNPSRRDLLRNKVDTIAFRF